MKKTMIMVAGLVAAILMVGCGSDKTEPTTKFTGEFEEEFFVEDIIIEDLVREDIIDEDRYVDDEYQKELEFNSRTNQW